MPVPPRTPTDLRPLNNVEFIECELAFLRKRWKYASSGLTPSRVVLWNGVMRTYWPRCRMVLELNGADLMQLTPREREDIRKNVFVRVRIMVNQWCKENGGPAVI